MVYRRSRFCRRFLYQPFHIFILSIINHIGHYLARHNTSLFETAWRKSNMGLWETNGNPKLWCSLPHTTTKIWIPSKTRASQLFKNFNNNHSTYFCFIYWWYVNLQVSKTKIISATSSNIATCATIGCSWSKLRMKKHNS